MFSGMSPENLQNIIILLFVVVIVLAYMLNRSKKKYIDLTHIINKMSLTPLPKNIK